MEKNIKNNLKCEICEKGFSSKKNKRRHLNIVHTEEKRFACNVCSKTYGTKGDLILHIGIHDQDREKNYNFDSCEKSFIRSDSLGNN